MLGGGDALQLSLIATLLCSAASIATVLPTFIFVLGGDGSALLIRSIPTLLGATTSVCVVSTVLIVTLGGDRDVIAALDDPFRFRLDRLHLYCAWQ